MRIVVAPDKFKGTLSAAEAAAALEEGLRSMAMSAGRDVSVVSRPVADGGEGTVEAALAAGFTEVCLDAPGPTGELGRTSYGRRGGDALVELARVCGTARLVGGRPAPLDATTLGLGVVAAHALDHGCRRLILAVGGSASTDGGAGLLVGLGARLLDEQGRALWPSGRHLGNVSVLDTSGLHPGLSSVDVTVASDVSNPLLGPDGAAAVYGPQKGAGPEEVALLEAGLAHWVEVVGGEQAAVTPGAGAAGGVGFGAAALLDARITSGIELVLELVGMDAALEDGDLVVVGEGSLDAQTLSGKAAAGMAALARRRGVPVAAVAGRVALGAADVARLGLWRAIALVEVAPSADAAMAEPARWLRAAAGALLEAWWDEHREASGATEDRGPPGRRPGEAGPGHQPTGRRSPPG